MVYVLLADGFELVEAMTPIDILRRAKCEVTTVGITGMQVQSAQGVTVLADCKPENVCVADTELVFLPGGIRGTENLYDSEFVQKFVRDCVENNSYLAAICAAPSTVLGRMGLLVNRCATCYPGMEDGMRGAIPQDEKYYVDGKIITGRSAGASMDFAFVLCAILKGQATAAEIARGIYYATN